MEEQVINLKGIKSYTEVLEVIKYLTPPECVSRIPKSLISFFEEYKDKSYDFHLDTSKILADQNISLEASQILAFLTLKYIGNETQKKEVSEILEENEKQYQKELNEKYSYDKLFKNKKEEIIENNIEQDITNQNNNQQLTVVDEKSSWIKKIFNKIKMLFIKKW